MAIGFASPKATVIICDGCEYLKKHTNEFDVIITDSSDPDGKFHHQKLFNLRFIFRSS
jgi:spermidine synthase